jgi:hypothetical protein
MMKRLEIITPLKLLSLNLVAVMAFCVFVDTKVQRGIAAKHQGVTGFDKISDARKASVSTYFLYVGRFGYCDLVARLGILPYVIHVGVRVSKE